MRIVREENYVTGFVHSSMIPRTSNRVVYAFHRMGCHMTLPILQLIVQNCYHIKTM